MEPAWRFPFSQVDKGFHGVAPGSGGQKTKSDITFSFGAAQDRRHIRLLGGGHTPVPASQRQLSLGGGQTSDMRSDFHQSRTRRTTFPLAVRFSIDATAAAADSSG